jgi:hypothetical protein
MNWIKKLFKNKYKEENKKIKEAMYELSLLMIALVEKMDEEYLNHDELMSIFNEEITEKQYEEIRACCDSFRD